MAASLQERLNYLVNYSSQLIFVGGDTLSSQTKALESFLFQQGENTEIAYVVSAADIELAEYRKQLCQQLLGQQSHSYHRPLNECLASLNTFEGPVMIAITRAEMMPKALLKELWELVLQSRFAGNKQHLNVIVFADKGWTKQAKSWLPDNSSGAPLLLSTQQASLYKAPSDTLQNLEQLASNPDRTSSTALAEHRIEQRPLISMGAFWAAMAIVFTCTLVGMAIWQKGDKLSGLFSPLNSEPDIQQPAQNPDTITTVAAENIIPLTSTANTTVINWNERAKPQAKLQPTVTSPAAVAVTSEPPANEAITSTTTEALQQKEVSVEPTVLDIFPKGQFAIQFAGFKSLEALEIFRLENNLLGRSQVYTTYRYGGEWHVLVHDTLFNSSTEARTAISTLPNFTNKNTAFIKSTNDIRKELRLLDTQDTL